MHRTLSTLVLNCIFNLRSGLLLKVAHHGNPQTPNLRLSGHGKKEIAA